MNNEEIQALMSKLQEAGLTPEDIADGVLWPLFRNGKMSKEDLGTLCSAIGLELDPDFEKDEGPAPEENITKEEAEAAKEIQPGESKEEFKEELEEAKESPAPEAEEEKEEVKEETSEDDKEPSEEEEWEEAKKLFKL